MKKLFLILLVIFCATLIGQAQSYTLYGSLNQTRFKSTTDVTITNTTAVEVWVKSLTQWPTTQHIHIDVDSVSGNHTAMALTLFGRNFDDAAWVSISGTIVNQGVDASVDITLTNTTETRWRQFRLVLTGSGTGVSKLNTMEMQLLYPD